MPVNSPFSRMFGQSPLGPIQEHIRKAHECAEHLLPFIDAAMAGDWKEAKRAQTKIAGLEEQADELKKKVRLSLPKSMFLPVPRNDLLDIVTVQDKVANRARDIAGLMLGREMLIPKPLQGAFRRYLERSIETSAQAVKAIHELDELLETGFRGREVDLVEDMIEELDKIEADTDDLQIAIRRALFKMEDELPPVDVMFLYRIIDWVGDLADRASRVGSRLQLLLAR